MTVWTIAAQEGTGGARLAAELALAADVPLLDRTALAALAHQLDPDCPEDDELGLRLGGRLHTLALSTAITAGSPDAFRDIELRHKLPALGRAVVAEAARTTCVSGRRSSGGSRPTSASNLSSAAARRRRSSATITASVRG